MTAMRQTKFPVKLCDRLASVRDDMTAARHANIGSGQATLTEALANVLDWWEATADMRAQGISGPALRDLLEQEASR